MTGATTHVASAKIQSPVVGLDGRDFDATESLRLSSGHVKHACPWLRPDGALPQITQRNALLHQRQIALLKSQSKLASLISDDLRRLTHSILKEGMRK